MIKKTNFCFYYLRNSIKTWDKSQIQLRPGQKLYNYNLLIKRHQESRNFVLPLFLTSLNILFEAVVHDTQKKMSKTNGKISLSLFDFPTN